MKIALIGASGFIGSKILAEALDRGHNVTAIVRNPKAIPAHANLTVQGCDIHDTDALTAILKGHDLAIAAFKAEGDMTKQTTFDNYVTAYEAIIVAIKASGTQRLLVVGGAASLKLPDGTEFIDSHLFPEVFAPNKVGIRGLREIFYVLQKTEGFDWAFLSPACMIEEGERTGKFRLGTDKLIVDDKGESRISVQDYAVVMIDEAENPQHHCTRWTAAY